MKTMQRLFLLLLSFFAWSVSGDDSGGTERQTTDITVEVNNIETSNGKIYLEVFKSEQDLAENRPEYQFTLVPEDSQASLIMPLIPGAYCYRLYHDVDDDGRMKQNVLGMPQEPWGVSNNVRARFGPPKWKKMKFTVDSEPQTHLIELR